MRKSNLILSLLVVIAAVATMVAQTPATSDTAAVTTGTDVSKSLEEILEEPATTDTYRYDPQGRRDPFRSLIGPSPQIDRGDLPEGVAGFLIDELKLQGIFRTKAGLTAMIGGPDNKGYLLRVGMKVRDGDVIRITQSSLVFRQEVNDPTRIERYREVVKDLAPAAAGKR